MTKLRVLHVINGLQAGGAEALLYRLAKRESGFKHEVISLIGPEWYSTVFEKDEITVHHLGIGSAATAAAAVPRLYRIMRQSRPDVVQTWLYKSNLFAGLIGRAAGVPVVWGIHTGSLEPLRLTARLWVYAGGLAARWVPDFVINCSSRGAEVHAKVGYDAAPGAVISNGYDPDVYFPDEEARNRTRADLGLAPTTFTLGFIRRWAPAKDVPTLVCALRIARDRGTPFRAIFVGSGLDADNAELVSLIRESGCEDVVTLLGRRSDVPDLGRSMDLHLLSSLVEAFPNIVGETMLCGTPNVVTDVGDCALMVGDSGWVVPPRAPEELAGAIGQAYAEWKDRPQEWQRRRSEARRLIAERFTFEGMAQAYENVWRSVARNGRFSGEKSC